MTATAILPVTDKTFTLGELLDAIEKDGYEQIFGGLWDDAEVKNSRLADPETTTKACALGQGMLNLGVEFVNLETIDKDFWNEVMLAITRRNDLDHLSPAVIAQQVREEFADRLDTEFHGYSFGTAIQLSWLTGSTRT